MTEKKLYVFYHIFADGKWQEPVSEFLKAYKRWGLIKQIGVLRVGVVGSEVNQTQVIQYLINEQISFEVVARALAGDEQVTQLKLHEFALNNDGYVLYTHTKGASRQDGVNELWRRSMYYYNVGQWELAVQKLDEGFDAVGQHWMFPTKAHPEHVGSPFFGGTTWWTSLEHIRKIGPPPMGSRYHAEGWIGYQYGHSMKCFDYTGHICSHPGHIAWTPVTQQWAKE